MSNEKKSDDTLKILGVIGAAKLISDTHDIKSLLEKQAKEEKLAKFHRENERDRATAKQNGDKFIQRIIEAQERAEQNRNELLRLHEIIVDKDLKIKAEHYRQVENIALERSISIKDAAEEFRKKLIDCQLDYYLPEFSSRSEQEIQKLANHYEISKEEVVNCYEHAFAEWKIFSEVISERSKEVKFQQEQEKSFEELRPKTSQTQTVLPTSEKVRAKTQLNQLGFFKKSFWPILGSFAALLMTIKIGAYVMSPTLKCQLGSMDSCASEAKKLINEGRETDAGPLLRRACNGGVVSTCPTAEIIEYRSGKLTLDAIKSSWLRSCTSGDLYVCHNLAFAMFTELSKRVDAKLVDDAIGIAEKSCSKDFPADCYQLGELFSGKKGMGFDAYKYFDKACEYGAKEACAKRDEVIAKWHDTMTYPHMGFRWEPTSGLVNYVANHSPAQEAGLKLGDKLVDIAGVPFDVWDKSKVTEGMSVPVWLLRNEQQLTINVKVRSFAEDHP